MRWPRTRSCPSRPDVLPWHAEAAFDDDLDRVIRDIAASANLMLAERLEDLVASAPPSVVGRMSSVPAGPNRRNERSSNLDQDPVEGGMAQSQVLIVGGGFAGVACARELAKHDDIQVTLIDKNDYHQFQPLLYQVATSMLVPRDTRLSRSGRSRPSSDDFEAKRGEVVLDRSRPRTA